MFVALPGCGGRLPSRSQVELGEVSVGVPALVHFKTGEDGGGVLVEEQLAASANVVQRSWCCTLTTTHSRIGPPPLGSKNSDRQDPMPG